LELGYWNWDIGIGILVRLEGFRGEEVCGTRITDGIVEGFDRTAGHKGGRIKEGSILQSAEGVGLGFGKFNQGKENWVARDIGVRDSGVRQDSLG